jgi:hypothetical protein
MSAIVERVPDEALTVEDLRAIWSALSASEKAEAFAVTPRRVIEDFFLALLDEPTRKEVLRLLAYRKT